jgi:hypothetical protein
MQRVQLELRATPGGRAGISELINDPIPTVREYAATHALFWNEGRARAELEAQAASDGLAAFGAEMVLREFDAGRLKADWVP